MCGVKILMYLLNKISGAEREYFWFFENISFWNYNNPNLYDLEITIFDDEKVSYYLDEDKSEFNYYTTLHGNKISYEDLDNFQTQNHGFLKGKEISAIESNFNVTPEEAED